MCLTRTGDLKRLASTTLLLTTRPITYLVTLWLAVLQVFNAAERWVGK